MIEAAAYLVLAVQGDGDASDEGVFGHLPGARTGALHEQALVDRVGLDDVQ